MKNLKNTCISLSVLLSAGLVLLRPALVLAHEDSPREYVVIETSGFNTKTLLAFAGALLLIGALFLLYTALKTKKQKKKPRRKSTRFSPRTTFSKTQLLLFALITGCLGVATIVSSYAASPLLNKASWASRVPLKLYDQGTGVKIEAVIAPWNKLAGRTILQRAPAANQAHIVFRQASDGVTTWVSRNDKTNVCIIYVGSDYGPDAQTMQHELGHCLGFRDHVRASELSGRNGANSPVCDNPGHPQYRAYRGIMSYCNWNDRSTWFGADDVRGLEEAGYKVKPPINTHLTINIQDQSGNPIKQSVTLVSGPRAFKDTEPAHHIGYCTNAKYGFVITNGKRICSGFQIGPISISGVPLLKGYRSIKWIGCDKTSPSGNSCWMQFYTGKSKSVTLRYYK